MYDTERRIKKEEGRYQRLSSPQFLRFTAQGLANANLNQTLVHLVINFSQLQMYEKKSFIYRIMF